MQLPSIRQLSFLIALADKGSFISAAESVFVTQPSLSAGIKELETILGTKLVERGRKGVKFTPAGKEAVIRARAIITSAIELKDGVRAAAEPLTGSFRLGIIPTIAPFLSPDAVPNLKKLFPKLRLYLREEQTGRLIDALRNHELDAAILALPYEASGIDTMPLMDDEFLFIAPKAHELANKKNISPEDIDISNILLLEDGHCLRDHALKVCGATGLGTEEVRATSLFTLVQMVAGGMGVSLIPKMAVDAGIGLDGVAVRNFNPKIIGRQIGIAWRKGSSRINEAKTLAKKLCNIID
jgi:LysR family transcriptional regulator, hydrogen peroxide-inducible genes activator